MGWFSDDLDPGYRHEGYAVALTQDDGWRWRELGSDDTGTHAVKWMQIGCSCGWRSPRMLAPQGTDWSPCCIFLPGSGEDPEHWEDVARLFWLDHMAGDLNPSMIGRSLQQCMIASR